MRISPALFAFSSAVFFGFSAFAATLSPEQGEVLVNRGDGYKRVSQVTQVAVGDQVIVKPGSSGRIVFSDGCTMNVVPGIVFTVAPKSPCKRVGSHIETGGSLKDDPMPEEVERDDRRYAIGALLAAGVPIGIMLLRDHNKNPVSP